MSYSENTFLHRRCSNLLNEIGVEVVTIPLPFRLNHVNCFIGEGTNGFVVIDAGLNNNTSEHLWKERLTGKDVSDMIITHYHPDHFGYSGKLQQETGARVHMTQVDADLGMKSWEEPWLERLRGNYRTYSVPDHLAEEMTSNTYEFVNLVNPLPKNVQELHEGESFQFGKFEYDIIFTPGHSDGLICFYNKDHNILFSTDHILPKITPNISYWFHGHPNPLAAYLTSLEKVKKLEADLVIPSHGKPFRDANKRIIEIQKHHEERLDQTLDCINEPATAYDICKKLFRNDLTVHEIRFALGETLAHLEYLRNVGECGRTNENGRWVYYR